MVTLIKNIEEIFTAGEYKSSVKNGYILIKEDKIVETGKSIKSTIEQIEKEVDQVIDGSKMIAIPGLVNTHTHAAMTLLRGYADDLPLQKWLENKIWPFESRLREEDIYWGTLLAIIEMIKTGTTTFLDMYFDMEQAAEAVRESGIRAVLSEGLIEENDKTEGLYSSLEFAREWQNKAEGRITTMLAPHSPYTCSESYLKEIIKLSERHSLPINIHLAETLNEVEIIKDKYNTTPVKYLEKIGLFSRPVIAAHCVHLNKEEKDILAENNTGIAYNPLSNMKLGSGIAPAIDYYKRGINIGFGTDGAASNNNLDLFEEAKIGSYLQKVEQLDASIFNTQDLLNMLTWKGARALNIDKLGKIKKGYKADIVLIDNHSLSHFCPDHDYLSNLFYSAGSRGVETVIINGQLILNKGEILTLDEVSIYKEVARRARQLA
ncbi:MAG: amidohydrolase [Halanaerobiales bacterium]